VRQETRLLKTAIESRAMGSLFVIPQLKIALMLKWFKQNLLALSREIFIDKAAARD